MTRTSKGQLFHYFPGGKEELLLAVARHEADRVLDDQQPHLGDLTSWALAGRDPARDRGDAAAGSSRRAPAQRRPPRPGVLTTNREFD
ncbi:hypothetical protein [Microlunatus sp. GCM10028923]|uniref:hypothetical protein n=1 Tax=Microlunatus sp. GCM10028923 TaxID=3273400 RepID=UPI00361281F3